MSVHNVCIDVEKLKFQGGDVMLQEGPRVIYFERGDLPAILSAGWA